MRLNEFANAEDQLGLLRIIITNTWSAIAQEAAAQKRQRAQQAAVKKSKPRAAAKPKIPTPRKPAPLPYRPLNATFPSPQSKPLNATQPVKQAAQRTASALRIPQQVQPAQQPLAGTRPQQR